MEDRVLNPLISSARVVVEHVIAGVKRCRIVKDGLTSDHGGHLGSRDGDCVRLAQSPRELSSSVPRLRCAELARLWLNPIMSTP